MNNRITEEEIEKILCGNAILFVGAGFSDGAIGYSGELPTSKKLAKIICELGDIEVGQEDLKLDLIADYFIENFPEKRKSLVNRLKDIFSVREVQNFHQTIVSLPWKRIYTTNYDNLVERASKTRIDGIDLDDPIPDEERYCLHINGRIENLTEEKLNSTFKLSRSSYISSSSVFTNNRWKKMFEDDLDISSLIVFIGYSLYDSDIESTLFGKAYIKNKTIFVMKKGEKNPLEDFKYEKYGRLLKIGAEGFADFFKNKKMIEQERIVFPCLEQYKNLHLDKIEKIEDKDRIAFFLTGSIDDKIIQYATLKGHHMNLILPREDLRNRAIEILEKKQNLILSGGLGNGKTIFLRQLATILANEYNVFFLTKDDDASKKRAIESLAKQNETSYILIDNFYEHKEILQFLAVRKYKNIKTILCIRNIEVEDVNTLLMDNGVSYGILNVDNLSEDDIELFVSILDALNFWKENNSLNNNEKKSYLRNHCKKEMSQILIEVLKSKKIEMEIRKIVDPLLRDSELRNILSAICFLSVISIEARFYILDEMIEEYEIKTLRRGENLKHFFSVDLLEGSVHPRSSVFSLFILRKYFDTAELSKIFLEFLKKINSKTEYKDIRRQLLSFNTLERIFGNNKLASLYGYYEDVKYCIKSMVNDPQYWLQVAMCHIACKKYDKAYDSLNRAYDEAKKTTHYKYRTEKIDNQMARLLVKQSLVADNLCIAFELFLKADNLLRKQSFSVYKYKIIFEYSGFFDKHFSALDAEKKEKIKKICSIYLKECEEKQRGEKSWREEIIFERCQSMLKKYVE